MPEFKVGDVVRLKSSGWPMTVEVVRRDEVYCAWMTRDGETRQSDFSPEVLVLVDDRP